MAMVVFVASDDSKVAGSSQSSIQPLIGGVTDNEEAINPLDNLSSIDVAVHVARLTKLDEATSVVNKADTVNAQQAVTPGDDQVIAKPQVISTNLKSKKDIIHYVAKAGDSVSSLASKFGITPNTIRYSNGLSGEEISPGQTLLISPINGIVYRVKSGDSPESIAQKYLADKEQLIAFNDAELTGDFKNGELIIIPDVYQPAQAASSGYGGYGAASSSFSDSFGSGYQAAYGGNGYDYGWCTWHAAKRRLEIGRPIPNNLGNAISWLSLAQSGGLAIGPEPRAGAVVYHLDIGGLGHVAFVERVNSNGSIWISDMNYAGHASMDVNSPATGGWGTVSYRLVQPNEFGSLRFIY
jgi:N-acetylmuramoyl-L-alanine amidase